MLELWNGPLASRYPWLTTNCRSLMLELGTADVQWVSGIAYHQALVRTGLLVPQAPIMAMSEATAFLRFPSMDPCWLQTS